MSALLWGKPLFQFLDVSQKSNLVALVRLVNEGLKRGALGGNIGEIAGRLRSRAFESLGFHRSSDRDTSTVAPHPPNHGFCNNYSVNITLVRLFYHTSPLALSMSWEVGKGIKYDYQSHKCPIKTQYFRFLCAKSSFKLYVQ
jgi:hypothetical protein